VDESSPHLTPESDFITHTLQQLEELRALEKVSRTEWAKRLKWTGTRIWLTFKGGDLMLSTVARMAHKLGKRPLIVFVDEVER